MHPSLIIDQSSTRPVETRRLDGILSALMWLVYLYMVREAFIDLYYIITESFEWIFAGYEQPHLLAISDLLHTLGFYVIIILANGAILITWALYNQYRFRGLDRRKNPKPVTVADLAGLYGLPAQDIENWQASRILVMDHDPDGALVRVISKDGGQILSPRPEEPALMQPAVPW
ncbi:MAG: poly-beta-1,6-N-acetyl-D-glucosamine biosynthesis protein PgaD [Stellaceae bacterium]|jgi:biofilm PGA synthesis protein PgaD